MRPGPTRAAAAAVAAAVGLVVALGPMVAARAAPAPTAGAPTGAARPVVSTVLSGLSRPSGIAVDGAGDVFVADTGACRVVELPARAATDYGVALHAGRPATVAGAGCGRGAGRVGFPSAVAVGRGGTLYVADGTGNRVLAVAADPGHLLGAPARARLVTTVAGTGVPGAGGDGGPAVRATLREPSGLVVDAVGDLLIADTGNCRVREVAARSGSGPGAPRAGWITTVAGTGTCGTAGLGGPAATAQLWDPTAVAVGAAGALYVADRGAGLVVVDAAAAGEYAGTTVAAGDVAAVAGAGIFATYVADGLPATGTTAALDDPRGLALLPGGALVVADGSDRAVRIVPGVPGTWFGTAMRAGAMYTALGALPAGPSGNSTRWVRAAVGTAAGVAVTPAGGLVVVDRRDGEVLALRA